MINKKHDLYYTSIEQSKRLLELGLNPETADMHHSKYTKIDNIDYVGIGYSELDKEEYGDIFLPCWSLGALFDVMPKIQEFDYSSLYKNHFGEQGLFVEWHNDRRRYHYSKLRKFKKWKE